MRYARLARATVVAPRRASAATVQRPFGSVMRQVTVRARFTVRTAQVPVRVRVPLRVARMTLRGAPETGRKLAVTFDPVRAHDALRRFGAVVADDPPAEFEAAALRTTMAGS